MQRPNAHLLWQTSQKRSQKTVETLYNIVWAILTILKHKNRMVTIASPAYLWRKCGVTKCALKVINCIFLFRVQSTVLVLNLWTFLLDLIFVNQKYISNFYSCFANFLKLVFLSSQKVHKLMAKPICFLLKCSIPVWFLNSCFRCDNKNMGVSLMCNLQSKVLTPPIFGSELHEEYAAIANGNSGADVSYATGKYSTSTRYTTEFDKKNHWHHRWCTA